MLIDTTINSMAVLKIGRYVLLLVAVLMFGAGCSPKSIHSTNEKENIASVLDDWHRAATRAEYDTYFNHMKHDAIFMGTDASEYWTKEEFKRFSKPYFTRGKAWNFTPVSRNIYLSESKQTAWFDEKLDTPNLGPARGSGVLIFRDTTWLIAHYNLSIPIPNAIVDTVVQQIAAEQAANRRFSD